MARALIVQLARLGDLLQTLPAITAIKGADPALVLDLLCPTSLSPIGRMLPGIAGARWTLRPRHGARSRPAC
jgi:heptosyltransferase I